MKQKFFTTRKAVSALLSMLLATGVACGAAYMSKPVFADDSDGQTSVEAAEGRALPDDYRLVIDNLLGESQDYTIADMTYLNQVNVGAPVCVKENTEISMTLSLDGNAVGGAFTSVDFDKYVCSGMPAGEYALNVTVSDKASEGEGASEPAGTETFNFTVAKKELPSLASVSAVIKGQKFKYLWDGSSHIYTASVAQLVNNYLESVAQPDLSGKIWENYSEYYGAPAIRFSLDGEEYLTDVEADSVGQHTVYYKLEAPNYDTAADCTGSFTVINIKSVAVPEIASKTYSGNPQSADIISTEEYTVEGNGGRTDAGHYYITLRLTSEDYIWEGESINNTWVDTKSIDFEIEKYSNSWIQSLGITTWTSGQYDKISLEEGEFAIRAEAEYGSVVITLTNVKKPDEILYRGANATAQLSEVLAGLKVGTYFMTATVEGDNNVEGLSANIFFDVFPQEGLAWWAILLIVIASLGVVVIILWILHEKGVLQMISGKVMLSIRTRMMMDATIAAVRANMVAEQSQKTREAAQRAERLNAARRARDEARNLPPDEQAAALDAKAQEADAKAARIQQQADRMKRRADALRTNDEEAADDEAQAEQTVATDENTTAETQDAPDSNEE